MNRSTIRSTLRRRLNDVPGDQWSDSLLNDYIDLAYALLLKQVRKVDPEALVFWETRATVAGTSWYEKPAGTRGIIEVGLKSSSADTDWSALPRRPYYIARDNTSVDTVVYCHRGQYIGIFPAPVLSIVGGIQFLHAPTDTLASDSDVPKLESTTHLGIVCWAALIARGESPEADNKDAQELGRILSDIPQDYGSNDFSHPMQLDLDVSDTRGRGATLLSSSPGIDNRR